MMTSFLSYKLSWSENYIYLPHSGSSGSVYNYDEAGLGEENKQNILISKNFGFLLFTFFQSSVQTQPSEVLLGKVFWKYAANLPENTHAEVWFQ